MTIIIIAVVLLCEYTAQTREVVSEAPEDHITPGLVTQPLSQEQWATLDKVNEALTKEYSVRRQMLLTRCDVTIQSFRWCDRAKVYTQYTATYIFPVHYRAKKNETPFSILFTQYMFSLSVTFRAKMIR